MKLLSDTNVAVVTSTIAIGHFDLQATAIPQNNTGANELIRSLPIKRKNIIHLGHTQSELNKISKLLNRSTQLESLAENTSSNISDGLINDTESEDYKDYSNVDSNEDFNINTNDHISNSDKGFNFNERNRKVNRFNQPMINQLLHQRKGQSHLQENELNRLLDTNSVQGNKKLNQEAYQPINNRIIQQQNSLFNQPTVNQFAQHHLVSNQANDGFNEAVNQFQEKTLNQQIVNYLVRNLLSKQNTQLDQSLNNPTQNHFSQQYNSLLSQLVNHQTGNQFNQQDSQGNEQHSKGNLLEAQLYLTGNQFTPNEQQMGQLSHTTNHPSGNQFLHQQADSLTRTVNNLVGSQFIQHQNAHTNGPTNHFSNPVSSRFTHQLNQPQNQLISHIISQHTGSQNSVKQPNQLIQTASNQWTQQTDQKNQLVNELMKSEVQHNDLSNKPAGQLNDKMKDLINLFDLTADSQVPEQQNDPSNQLANILLHPESNQISQQNSEVSLPATQSIHPATMHLITQENDQDKQFINTASNPSPQQQNIQTHTPTIQLNHPTTTSLMKPSATVQLNQLAHIVSNLLSHKQNAQTNQNEIQIPTGTNQLMPQKNIQFILPHNTRFSRSMSQLIDTVNDQAIYVTYDQSKQPTDLTINSAEKHISNSSKFNGTNNNFMHLIHNQVTKQNTEQNNQFDNKLIQPTINERGNSHNICTNQHRDNDNVCKYRSKATDTKVNSTKDESYQIKGFLPKNHKILPVINEFNNISGNHSTHRENSKFANRNKNTTQNKTVDNEPSQSKDDMNIFKTSTDFSVTNTEIQNIAPVSMHAASESTTIT